MRILAVSDVESRFYYTYYRPGCLSGFDLILACGDLSRVYLEFLVTMANCPLVYVRGNHDEAFIDDPPEGCVCAEDRIVVVNGVRILGLGGSFRYKRGECMYTEGQMCRRIRRRRLDLIRHGGFDILLTHAPARGINDFDTLSHRGFECFRDLMSRYEPAYLVHGHVHMNYGMNLPRVARFGETTVINAYEHHIFETAPKPGGSVRSSCRDATDRL
ncbi:MAG: metallophosphoesterase family protein [Clostridia bacterium]|nr:metallophosphoesterase family protein [Clostridia bacterium]